MNDFQTIFDVLSEFEFADCRDALIWNVWDDSITFAVDCSDWFAWGGTDSEPIETAEDVELFRRCRLDLEPYGRSAVSLYCSDLYACRRRWRRPMARAFPEIEEPGVRALFLACGPEPTRED